MTSAPAAALRQLLLSWQVEGEIFYVVGGLVPLVERFDIDAAEDVDAVVEKVLHKMAADESTGAADHSFFSLELHSGRGLLFKSYC